jgi:hypothetical protein
MSEIYSISNSNHFNGISPNVDDLQEEIATVLPIINIEIASDEVKINFSSSLTTNQKLILDNLVSSHVALPVSYIDLSFINITIADSPFKLLKESVKCDTQNGNITVNLAKASRNKYAKFIIQKIHASNNVSIIPHGTNLIDNQTSCILTDFNEFVYIESDGVNWNLLSNDINVDPIENYIAASITDEKGSIIVDNGARFRALEVGVNNQVLIADSSEPLGVKWGAPSFPPAASIFGSEFQTAEKTNTTYTSSTSMVNRQTMVTPALPAGTYRIEFMTMHQSSRSLTIGVQVQVNNSSLFGGQMFAKEAKDSDSGQREFYTGADYYTGSGVLTIDIDFKRAKGSGYAYMKYSRITIWRIC